MKLKVLLIIMLFISFQALSQGGKDKFTVELALDHTPVIDQGSTGTCWSFATTSFLESEIMRKGFPETDLSEMYFVYVAYQDKAMNYLKNNGQTRISQGGLAHDVMNVIRKNGMVTNDVLKGKQVKGKFNHNELINKIKSEIKNLNNHYEINDLENINSLNDILNKYIGKLPKRIKIKGRNYTPSELRDVYEINPDDYVEITSYENHPFYQKFILEIPDNWANAAYYNLPINELMEVMTYSLKNGYTFCWDGDTSEKTFSSKSGEAYLPENQVGNVDQDLRQKTFNNRTTTDDHLMHVVGLSKDEEGKTCFYTKNSWGADSNDFGGYINLTEDYVKLKTISVLVHKDAIPADIRKKINL